MSAHFSKIKDDYCNEEECTGCHPELLDRELFMNISGKDPIDVLGHDWADEIEEFLEASEMFHERHEVGSCFDCKMD